MLALHRSRCIDWRPKPIVAMAATTIRREDLADKGRDLEVGTSASSGKQPVVDEEIALLAVARASGRIEVWERISRNAPNRDYPVGDDKSPPNAWQKAKDVPGLSTVVCKCLAWFGGCSNSSGAARAPPRLIGGTLEGHLIEIDLSNKKPKKVSVDATGCGIWSIQAMDYDQGSELFECRTLVACACDDGVLRVYGTDGKGACDLRLKQTYPKANCRLLSLAWHKKRKDHVVVGGSDGYMSLWNLKTKAEVFAINAKIHRTLGVSIWSLDVLDNGDVVSGDSSGAVRIWDGSFGSLLKTFQVHKRDVLSVVCSKNKVFSSGVDGQIILLTQENRGKSGDLHQWGFKGKKRPHSHDVLALAMAQGTLFSGGNDTRLLTYDVQSFLRNHPSNLQAYGEIPRIQVAGGQPGTKDAPTLMMCQQLSAVEIWRIETIDQESEVKAKLVKGKEGLPLRTRSSPKLVAILSSDTNVTCSALSLNGRHLAYSNMSTLHLYSLVEVNPMSKVTVSKVKSQDHQMQKLEFTPNGNHLVGLNLKNECCIYDVRKGMDLVHVFEHVPTSPNVDPGFGLPVLPDELLCVSAGSEFAAVTSKRRVVLIFNLAERTLHGVVKSENFLSSLCFDKESRLLLACTADQHVLFFDLKSCSVCEDYSDHGRQVAKRLGFISSGAIKDMSCKSDGKGNTYVMLNTVRGLCFVNLSKPVKDLPSAGSSEVRRKRARAWVGHTDLLQLAAREGQNPRILPLEDPCIFACFYGERSALIVECPWIKALRDVPRPLQKKVYGMA